MNSTSTITNGQPFRVEQLTPALGARIDDICLADVGDGAVIDQLYDCLMQHKVLFFPDQKLTPTQQVEFAERFGEVAPPHALYRRPPEDARVTMIESGPDQPPDTDAWHTDMTYRVEPPFASVLHARDIPPIGGDTVWLSLAAAYESMPQSMKEMVADLKAVHDMGSFRNDFANGDNDDDPTALNEGMQQFGSAIHPIVRPHPVTKQLQLYVNRGFTNHVVGMQTQDSQRLLGWLFDHMERPEHQVRLRWSVDLLAIWDNRITAHYAINDYMPAPRRMHRVTIIRDRREP